MRTQFEGEREMDRIGSTMACDYDAIRRDNLRRYGTDIGRYGPTLLANRYGDRTHFIYELLQNAEDALARRTEWQGSRAVSFELTGGGLRVSHFGVPFDEDDIRGICGIAESTKSLTAIGRFGIGFKSVYAFSDRPEVHSGSHAFAIENFVWPVATDPVERKGDETVIFIPLRQEDGVAKAEIADGLSRLGTTALLFLQEIEEIRWSVDNTRIGLYLRGAVRKGPEVRSVTVVGKKQGEPEAYDEWLVFSRPVHTEGGGLVGQVELAWLTEEDEDGRKLLTGVQRSPLVVFFPTVVETELGFLIQGPYRTTPSRDNVPPRDEWNRTCVRETGVLLIKSLRWLRDEGLLDVTALSCLPLDSVRFKGSMFRELFEETEKALKREDLLPVLGGTYASAADSCLARTEELRELLSPTQLAALHGRTQPLRWLDRTITRNRTPELQRYLIHVLGIREFTPKALLPHLKAAFLEAQTDEWMQDLYKFLGSLPALRSRLASLPIIRLKDGSHVPPTGDDEPQAFLPGSVETSFPTVRAAVCRTDEAREFLKSLNLTQPDPVDNVIRNVLPKYRKERSEFSEVEYSLDIGLMLGAVTTDSRAQQERLVKALGETPWLRAVDATGERALWAKPGDLYLATERLRGLFEGVGSVLFVDASVTCLRGKEVRELLERSGATRYLQPKKVHCDLPWEQRTNIRRSKGLERSTWSNIEDKTIRGLDAVLDKLATLDPIEQRSRARGLWEALGDLNKRRGSRPFEAVYTWGFFQEKKVATFDPAFVRMLNRRRWVPDSSGSLHRPGSIAFEDVGWKPNSFLESKIRFKPPLLEQLAREAGIEPGVLDLLRRLGVTSEAKLRKRLGVGNQRQEESVAPEDNSEGSETTKSKIEEPQGGSSGARAGQRANSGKDRSRDSATEFRFISYLGVVSEDEDADPDGLKHAVRMELEEAAIRFILDCEPKWQRTPANNPGFDLYRGDTMHTATHWCEVKAMTGTLDDRPVGISSAQFEWARDHGDTYWLYIVERAGKSNPNFVRIQDPAGKAKTFTFDRGWRAVARADGL